MNTTSLQGLRITAGDQCHGDLFVRIHKPGAKYGVIARRCKGAPGWTVSTVKIGADESAKPQYRKDDFGRVYLGAYSDVRLFGNDLSVSADTIIGFALGRVFPAPKLRIARKVSA